MSGPLYGSAHNSYLLFKRRCKASETRLTTCGLPRLGGKLAGVPCVQETFTPERSITPQKLVRSHYDGS